MRIEIKAILHSVEEIVKKDDLKYQYILLEKPVFDQFDGSKVRTDYYPCTIFNDKINRIGAATMLTRKVSCVCYLNSQKQENDGKTFYNLRLKIHSMELIKEAVRA